MVEFDLVLYNSTVSNEIMFPNLPEIQDIKQQVNLVEEGKHSGYDTYHKHRVLYPELMRSESAIWSLVDFFLFQVPNLKVDRKEMFKKMAEFETQKSLIKKTVDYRHYHKFPSSCQNYKEMAKPKIEDNTKELKKE